MSAPTNPVSLLAAASQGWERMGQLLFRPFDLSRWMAIGFGAWLAGLGEGMGGGGGGGWQNRRGGNPRAEWDRFWDYFGENLHWIGPLLAVLIVVGVIVGLAILWLSSRGRFMLLHNVATGGAEVVVPWRHYRQHGNNLFLFRVVLALLGLVVMAPLIVAIAWPIVLMVRQGEPRAWGILLAGFALLAAIVAGVLLAVIEKLLKDFVVPIMWLRTPSCVAAWREFLGLLGSNLGNFAVYLLFHLVLSLVVGMALLAAVLITCCLAGCLMAIPYLGTVLILPIPVFLRAFSLHYLAQYGAAYDVFPRTR